MNESTVINNPPISVTAHKGTLITTTPQNFKGGNIWKVIVDINGAVQAIGLALLVLFFVIGMVKTCGSFSFQVSRAFSRF